MCSVFFFSSRRRHTRCSRDWSSDVCSSDLGAPERSSSAVKVRPKMGLAPNVSKKFQLTRPPSTSSGRDRKSTRLNSSHGYISYAVFCLKKKKLAPTYGNVPPQHCHTQCTKY